MSADTIEAFLAYATIPIYVFGLLLLVYVVAHSQLGLSVSQEIKESVKTELAQERPKAPISTYVVVVAMFALFTLLTITTQRRQRT